MVTPLHVTFCPTLSAGTFRKKNMGGETSNGMVSSYRSFMNKLALFVLVSMLASCTPSAAGTRACCFNCNPRGIHVHFAFQHRIYGGSIHPCRLFLQGAQCFTATSLGRPARRDKILCADHWMTRTRLPGLSFTG